MDLFSFEYGDEKQLQFLDCSAPRAYQVNDKNQHFPTHSWMLLQIKKCWLSYCWEKASSFDQQKVVEESGERPRGLATVFDYGTDQKRRCYFFQLLGPFKIFNKKTKLANNDSRLLLRLWNCWLNLGFSASNAASGYGWKIQKFKTGSNSWIPCLRQRKI